MTAFLKLHVVSRDAFPARGAVWRRLVAGNFYRVPTGELPRPDPRPGPRWATIGAAGWLGVA